MKITATIAVAIILTAALAGAADPLPEPRGALPVGGDGKALNFDFEDGTLRDWTAEGGAFQRQPYKGPIDQKRQFGGGRVANHQGEYWIGGYEVLQDGPRGTLTSVRFKVTQPFAAFRFNGGTHAGTRIELVRADSGEVFLRRAVTTPRRCCRSSSISQRSRGERFSSGSWMT